VVDGTGVEGQSTGNPASCFQFHVLERYKVGDGDDDVGDGYTWFDPNYGKSYAGADKAARELAFDGGAIDGYFRGPPAPVMVKESEIGVDLDGVPSTNTTVASSVVFLRKNVKNTKEVSAQILTDGEPNQ
jgi:hypothetical protein